MTKPSKKLISEGPELADRMSGNKRRGKYLVVPDGRTKKAYDHQPKPGKYVCSICINARRVDHLKAEKGKDHASAKEVEESSFNSEEHLLSHKMLEHPNHVPTGEQKNYNRQYRDMRQATP